LPAELGKLTKLEVFSVAGSHLTGMMSVMSAVALLLAAALTNPSLCAPPPPGSLPAELGKLTKLEKFYVRGNLIDGQASDLEALLALRQALTGLDKLGGWSDLRTHRDVSKCEGIEVDEDSGRVTGLDLHYKGLSGGHVQCKGHDCLLQH
jgi:hypothetical protein